MHQQIILFINKHPLQLLIPIPKLITLYRHSKHLVLLLLLHCFHVFFVAGFDDPLLILNNLPNRYLFIQFIFLINMVLEIVILLFLIQHILNLALVLVEAVF